MATHKRCPVCNEWGWFDSPVLAHHCQPEWECRGVWESWPGAEWSRVHAGDAEEAAEKYAEQYDCEGGEYAIVGGRMRSAVVLVRKPNPDEDCCNLVRPQAFAIEAEAVPTYRGCEVDLKKAAA